MYSFVSKRAIEKKFVTHSLMLFSLYQKSNRSLFITMCIDSTKGEDDSSKPEESMDAANPDPATTTDDSEMEEKRSKGKENGTAEVGAGSQDQEEATVAEDQAAF